MVIFNTDLDNTILYSYKHDLGCHKKNVELYNGREISFISEETFRLLKEVTKKCLLVPTTTRSIEQYQRINLGLGAIPYALVCNGGILLENGSVNKDWYQDSKKRIAESESTIQQSIKLLQCESRRYFELRYLEELFVFTKCTEAEDVIRSLRCRLDTSLVDIFHNGEKVYVIPKALSKGNGVKRLRDFLKADMVIAAGDSEFDITMVEIADLGIVPSGFKERFHIEHDSVAEAEGTALFSEEVLKKCLYAIPVP